PPLAQPSTTPTPPPPPPPTRRSPDLDAHGPRVPADARRRPGVHPGDRGRDRRLQHPVRGGSGRRADGADRDEPARVAVLGARVEDRNSTRLNSSHVAISYAVFCLKKK